MKAQRRPITLLLVLLSALAIGATTIILTNTQSRQSDAVLVRKAIADLERIETGLQAGSMESLLELASSLRANFRFPGNLRRLAREFVPELEQVPDSTLSEWIENHAYKLDFDHESRRFTLRHSD